MTLRVCHADVDHIQHLFRLKHLRHMRALFLSPIYRAHAREHMEGCFPRGPWLPQQRLQSFVSSQHRLPLRQRPHGRRGDGVRVGRLLDEFRDQLRGGEEGGGRLGALGRSVARHPLRTDSSSRRKRVVCTRLDAFPRGKD